MMLTTKGRYAVMAMVDIAVNGVNQPISLEKISERQNIAINYLEQIFVKLRKSGLVSSFKGPGGGYVLTKTAGNISVAEVIQAVNESIKMTRCSGEEMLGCKPNNVRCSTHELWHGLEQNIFQYLNSITLADVSNNNSFSAKKEVAVI